MPWLLLLLCMQVHCQVGMSRSTSFVLAHLLLRGDTSLADAFASVKERRPRASPNAGEGALVLGLFLQGCVQCRHSCRTPPPPLACLSALYTCWAVCGCCSVRRWSHEVCHSVFACVSWSAFMQQLVDLEVSLRGAPSSIDMSLYRGDRFSTLAFSSSHDSTGAPEE